MEGVTSSFQSARLRYVNSTPLLCEMLCLNGEVETFLSLPRFRWSSNSVPVHVRLETEEFQEITTPLEGGMRLRLSPTTTKRLISALQEGQEVVILVDGFEERLQPEQFGTYFEQLVGQPGGLINFLKGPFL